MPGSSRKPAEEKESPFPSGKNVHAGENHHAGNETPRWSGHGLGKTTTPASRGAEAIPATRERSSRRAYRPRSGKMRADLPPAASDGQGTRQATATPAATRDKGEYGGRRGCRGARPSHPLPPAAQATTPRCRAEAAIQREKNFYAQRPRPCGPPFGRSPGGDHARMSGSSRYPAAEKKERKEERKEGRKEENRPPRQASSVSRTTSRMSGSLRISSMS